MGLEHWLTIELNALTRISPRHPYASAREITRKVIPSALSLMHDSEQLLRVRGHFVALRCVPAAVRKQQRDKRANDEAR